MDIDRIRALRLDCQELTKRFYRSLDTREYAQLSQHFAADGVWLRQGKQLVGPAAVLDEITRRPPTVVTRHVITNQIADVLDAEHIRSQCYITLYYADPGEGAALPIRFTGPTCLFTYHEELRWVDDAWKIARKWSTMDFSAV